MNLDLASYNNYGYLAQLVSDYDLWHHQYPESKKLQFLWSKIGTEQFIARFLQNSSMIMSEEEESFVKESMDALEESYQIAIANMDPEEDSYGNKWLLIKNIGAMYSLVADRILKENPDAAYCCIMSRKGSLSFRSQYYDVEQIAKALGGGGHLLAAGAPMVEMMDVISSVYQREVVTFPFK
jgi:oligoribonuclease NrnB/cAMP/cGMP phosphodiesterase (DHH superfamily)